MSGDLFGKHRCNRLDFPGMRCNDDERVASPLMFNDDAVVSAFDLLSAQGFEVGVVVWYGDSFWAKPSLLASSLLMITLPIGHSEIGMSLRCAQANGRPTMLIANKIKIRWPSASHHPARISQIRFPRAPEGPVPRS